MLRGMRKASSNWLGRIVMGIVLGLIAVSFAIWGIGDIFRGFGQSTVAKIGSTEITVTQFRQIYNDRIQQLGRELGRPITPDQAKLLRLDQQLVGQLVAEAALDQRARQLRLNVSDAEVARQIMNDPSFKGLNGQFDRARFEQLIRNAGFTEQRFTAEQKRITMRREVADTVQAELTPPQTMADAQNRYDNEQRAIDYVVLDSAKAGEVPAPTPEQIAKYYDERKSEFRTPEYRTVAILSVAAADLAKPDSVTDADAKQFYDANAARFGTPERRQVAQISFPNAEEAQAAAARLEKSELTFEALAKERGLSEKDIDLGLVTKSGMIDRAVADAAFALKEGETSAPIKGMFGTMLVHVVKVEPENVKPFDQVAAEIKQAIATDRARSEIAAIHDKVEDERAGGSRLTEIAQKLNLKARTIEAVDRQGRDPDGKPISDLPSTNVISSAFGSDVGVENEPLQMAGGGYLWFEVLGVKRSGERTLDEVRAQVEQRWRESSGLGAAEGKGGRDRRQGEGRHLSQRCRVGRGPQCPDHIWHEAFRQYRLVAALRGERSVRDAEGWRRQRRRQGRKRARHFPGDRCLGAGVRCELGRQPQDHGHHAPLDHRRLARAIRHAAADRSRRDHQHGCGAPERLG